MPLYEYECDACAHRFERIQKFSDALVDVCPKCGGTVRKLFSSPAIQFKGSGWYITDYAKKTGSVDSSSSAKNEGGDQKSDQKSEQKGDQKSEQKSEKKSEGSEKSSAASESKPTTSKGNSEG